MELVDDSMLPTWFQNLPPEDQKRLKDFINQNTEHVITYGMASALTAHELVLIFFRFGELVKNVVCKQGETK